jgi:hypothetical protein
LLLLMQGGGFLPEGVAQKVDAAPGDRLRAVSELLGKLSERAVQLGQLRPQGSPFGLAPALRLHGGGAQHVGMLAAFR